MQQVSGKEYIHQNRKLTKLQTLVFTIGFHTAWVLWLTISVVAVQRVYYHQTYNFSCKSFRTFTNLTDAPLDQWYEIKHFSRENER
jgi:hypothetical protein